MKQFASFAWDGFKGSIELMRFIDGVTDDLIEAITALVGTDTVFIKGGVSTVVSGNTTVTDGIIYKDGKLYHFTGGTFTGALPDALEVIFQEQTASGFPQPYFVGDPTPKDIYLDRTAVVGTPSGGDVHLTLNTIGSIRDLQYIKSKVDLVDGKADKNGYTLVSGISLAPGFSSSFGNPLICREYHDGTIQIQLWLFWSGAKTNGTHIATGFPAGVSISFKYFDVYVNGPSVTEAVAKVKIDGLGRLIVYSGFNSDITGGLFYIEYKKN
jgi:hypothetical protein